MTDLPEPVPEGTRFPLVPESYAASRRRFLAAAELLGAQVRSFELANYRDSSQADQVAPPTGPDGVPLFVDATIVGPANARHLVIASCGLHGVEGYFGAAVIQRWMMSLGAGTVSLPPETGVVLLHALNPWGFAWDTRFNEDNVDPNRNFLLPGEAFRGAPPMYAQLDPLLNPPYLPSRLEPVRWKMGLAVLRYGMSALQQAVAGGQYEYPRGLFYGGHGPIATQRLLAKELPALAGHAERVIHMDFHTGLGRRGTYMLIVEERLSDHDRAGFAATYGADKLREPDHAKKDYQVRGDIGRWCQHLMRNHRPDAHYLSACAEFGTYPPLNVVIGLREENLTRQYLAADHPRRRRARQRLRELFCPGSPRWQRWAIPEGADLITKAAALASQPR